MRRDAATGRAAAVPGSRIPAIHAGKTPAWASRQVLPAESARAKIARGEPQPSCHGWYYHRCRSCSRGPGRITRRTPREPAPPVVANSASPWVSKIQATRHRLSLPRRGTIRDLAAGSVIDPLAAADGKDLSGRSGRYAVPGRGSNESGESPESGHRAAISRCRFQRCVIAFRPETSQHPQQALPDPKQTLELVLGRSDVSIYSR